MSGANFLYIWMSGPDATHESHFCPPFICQLIPVGTDVCHYLYIGPSATLHELVLLQFSRTVQGIRYNVIQCVRLFTEESLCQLLQFIRVNQPLCLPDFVSVYCGSWFYHGNNLFFFVIVHVSYSQPNCHQLLCVIREMLFSLRIN